MPVLSPGSKLGPYEIVSPLGAGGMGEVYSAHDARLDRGVAIKILPHEFATDSERLARFHREAKALAALNHPHIAGIHGFEEWHGATALVMELVPGEDLAARLARGAMPLEEALHIARQIADGLEAAHQQGILHRDLKPANIKVRPDGTVKLLDFGLAKVLDPAASGVSQAPTVTSAELTRAGVVVGTAPYMSPEQTRGKVLDRRADIWAFGCVLYEMLTGRRAFGGDHPSEVVAAVLGREPDFASLPPATPVSVRRLLRRSLQKDPSQRLRDMGDARLELSDAELARDEALGTAHARPIRAMRERVVWMTAVAALLTALAILPLRPTSDRGELRLEITTPPTPSPTAVAISPDGTRLVFVASSGDDARLWLRPLEADSGRPLEGTEGADAPFWSPDGKSIGFFADGKLKRIDLDGGSVQSLANAATGLTGTWGRGNVILFASRGNPISRVSADKGGDPVAVGGLVPGSNFAPSFLPDGRHFLYYLRGSPEVRGVHVGDLDGPDSPQRVLDTEGGAVYSATGHLLFNLQNKLLAQPFDLDQLRVSGDPIPIAAGTLPGQFALAASVSTTGTIAYRAPSARVHRQFKWFDRTGRDLGVLGGPGDTFSSPMLSRDGERVAFYRGLDGNVDIWTMDTRRGTPVRETTHPGDDVGPIWSPDGSRMAMASNRSGRLGLYIKRIGTEHEEALVSTTSEFQLVTDWSSDGRFLLLTIEGAKRSLDIWAMPLEGERKPFPLVQSPDFSEQRAQFSPDGRWFAYLSNESGRHEVYIRAFPDGGHKVPISTDGGTQVRWNPNGGTELFYVSRTGDLMVVPVKFPPGEKPSAGVPQKLFRLPIGSAIQMGDARPQYVVSPDGRLLVVTVTPPPTAPISLILDWRPRPLR